MFGTYLQVANNFKLVQILLFREIFRIRQLRIPGPTYVTVTSLCLVLMHVATALISNVQSPRINLSFPLHKYAFTHLIRQTFYIIAHLSAQKIFHILDLSVTGKDN